jgi:hypothetical protein
MSIGKSGGSSTTIPTLSPEQNAQIAAQTGFFTGTVEPTYQQAVTGATNLYNNETGGVNTAAQNLAGTASQAQNVLGTTGQSALQTGIQGLENVDSAAYQQQQLAAALAPAQAQYAQNIANQQAQFGGAGQLGSARSALAQAQTAGATEAAQEQTAATVANNIANQQMSANQALTSAGQTNLTGALNAANAGVTAAMTPQQLYNQYASVLYGTPSSSYSPNFSGTQSTTTNTSQGNLGISI